MLDFLKSFFRPQGSGATAKERLRLVLLSDHLSLAPEMVEELKSDLFALLSRYVEIDSEQAEVTFEHRDREIAMIASVPILRVLERSIPAAAPLHAIPAPAAQPIEEPDAEPVAASTEPLVEAASQPAAQAQAAPETLPELEVPKPVKASNGTTNGASNGTRARRRRRKNAAGASRNGNAPMPPPETFGQISSSQA
jgi:cell division topological specificity factor